jgi:hypothetical protein
MLTPFQEHKGQTSDMSWWPKHSAFTHSGLDLGHWSEFAEEWYMKRLRRIWKGEVGLKSGKDWRNGLGFQKATAHIAKGNRETSAACLTRLIHIWGPD